MLRTQNSHKPVTRTVYKLQALCFASFLLACFCLARAPLLAQAPLITLEPSWQENPEVWLDSLIGIENSPLFSGPQHTVSSVGAISHPFFVSKKWAKGSVRINSYTYEVNNLLYDTHQDLLLVQHYNQNGLPITIVIQANRVEAFGLHDKVFWHLQEQNSNSPLQKGYHQVLYAGEHLQLFAKRYKAEYLKDFRKEYSPDPQYFVRIPGRYDFQIKSDKDILQEFAEHKENIKNYIKRNRLKIRPSKEEDMIQLISYCEQFAPKTN